MKLAHRVWSQRGGEAEAAACPGPAEVVAADAVAGRVEVRMATGAARGHLEPVPLPRSAHWALPPGVVVVPGDSVLVVPAGRELYAVARLGADPPRSLTGSSGAAVELSDGEEERLRVYSPERELVFEYDPEARLARVFVADGNLELATGRGSIVLDASEGVALRGRTVDLDGEVEVGLRAGGVGERTTVDLRRRELRLESPELRVAAGRGSVHARELRLAGHSFEATFEQFRVAAERLSLLANTLLETARNAYRDVEELCRTRVGRMRTLVEETFQLCSGRTLMRSRTDHKVRAEQIHLG